MLSPSDFEANEAWVLFRLNKSPILLGDKRDYDLITLMDAASSSELSRDWVSVTAKEAWGAQARRLLEKAVYFNKNQLPKTIVVTKGALADFIGPEALRRGIHVKSVPQYELVVFASERRQAFAQKVKKSRLL